MKRKEMEKVIRVEELKRKMRLARCNKKYIRFLYYKFILFVINLFDNANKVINGFNYKGEWEKQNKLLDIQKKRIDDLEKEKKLQEEIANECADLAHERYLVIEELKKKLTAEKQTTKNLKKRIREIKKK